MYVTLPLPESRAHIKAIQKERKRLAFERAKRSKWYAGKLDKINPDRLDEPEEWAKIPILDKDTLRKFSHAELLDSLNVAPRDEIVEYWRSGGSTGKPVFYPRTQEDVHYGMVSWGRSFDCMGMGKGDLCHMTFPIGIHPAGQVWARSAVLHGVGMLWVGGGNVVPSAAQIELIQTLQPTVLMGMGSFLLRLANVADSMGIDLSKTSIRKVVTTAEPLSLAKRRKIEELWGAEDYDVFGMSEAGLMGAENAAHDGIHIWTDMYHIEVVDEATGEILPEGQTGTFCVTPLWTNHATPFLRWNSGDVVSLHDRSKGTGKFAELFPVIRHAHRTTGFFKIRGVNVNHNELEDLLLAQKAINDFQAILSTDPQTSLEILTIRAELRPGYDAGQTEPEIKAAVKKTFEIACDFTTVPLGTLAAEFDSAVKTPRFLDKRL